MIFAGIVAAFLLGILVSGAVIKRLSRHFPANENIGKTVLQMTRHSGFNDFLAAAFLAGLLVAGLVGSTVWYLFPRTITVTEQVPVDRIVTREVIKEVPVVHEVVREVPAAPAPSQAKLPAPIQPNPSSSVAALPSGYCPDNYDWNAAHTACVHWCPQGYLWQDYPPGCRQQ